MVYSAFIGFSWSASFHSLFNISSNLGLLSSYKILRGTSVNNAVNSSRVCQSFVIRRQTSYSDSSMLDVGVTSVRFGRTA